MPPPDFVAGCFCKAVFLSRSKPLTSDDLAEISIAEGLFSAVSVDRWDVLDSSAEARVNLVRFSRNAYKFVRVDSELVVESLVLCIPLQEFSVNPQLVRFVARVDDLASFSISHTLFVNAGSSGWTNRFIKLRAAGETPISDCRRCSDFVPLDCYDSVSTSALTDCIV